MTRVVPNMSACGIDLCVNDREITSDRGHPQESNRRAEPTVVQKNVKMTLGLQGGGKLAPLGPTPPPTPTNQPTHTCFFWGGGR